MGVTDAIAAIERAAATNGVTQTVGEATDTGASQVRLGGLFEAGVACYFTIPRVGGWKGWAGRDYWRQSAR